MCMQRGRERVCVFVFIHTCLHRSYTYIHIHMQAWISVALYIDRDNTLEGRLAAVFYRLSAFDWNFCFWGLCFWSISKGFHIREEGKDPCAGITVWDDFLQWRMMSAKAFLGGAHFFVHCSMFEGLSWPEVRFVEVSSSRLAVGLRGS